MRARIAAAVAAAMLASPGRGAPSAAEPLRIAVVVGHAGDRIGRLLEAEIRALGLAPTLVIEAAGAASPRWLDDVARTARAAAAIRIVAVPPRTGAPATEGTAAPGIEVWLADRITGKIVLRDIVEESGTPVRENVIVLRAIELLRASLLEVNEPHPSRGQVAATPDLAPLTRPRGAGRYALAMAPAVLASTGGVRPIAAGAVAFIWAPTARVEVELTAVLPVAASVETEAGRATLAPRLLAAGLARAGDVAGGRLRLRAAAMAGAAWSRTEGNPAPGYVGSTDDRLLPVLLGRAGAALVLTSHLRLAAELAAGGTTRRLVVRFAGTDVATWGRPLLVAALRLEVTWP